MREAADFFASFQEGLVKGLYTSAICRIEAYYPEEMKADVTLLPDEVLIPSVPVSTLQTDEFVVRMPYKKGNLVVVVFAMRDIDSIMHSDSATATDRMLAIDDAMVVCGISPFAKRLPADHAEDLVIATKPDFKTKIVLTKSGNVTVEADGTLELKAGSEIKMTAPLINAYPG